MAAMELVLIIRSLQLCLACTNPGLRLGLRAGDHGAGVRGRGLISHKGPLFPGLCLSCQLLLPEERRGNGWRDCGKGRGHSNTQVNPALNSLDVSFDLRLSGFLTSKLPWAVASLKLYLFGRKRRQCGVKE
jgi:hypothetical protein